jgi:hypothetical protein
MDERVSRVAFTVKGLEKEVSMPRVFALFWIFTALWILEWTFDEKEFFKASAIDDDELVYEARRYVCTRSPPAPARVSV